MLQGAQHPSCLTKAVLQIVARVGAGFRSKFVSIVDQLYSDATSCKLRFACWTGSETIINCTCSSMALAKNFKGAMAICSIQQQSHCSLCAKCILESICPMSNLLFNPGHSSSCTLLCFMCSMPIYRAEAAAKGSMWICRITKVV